MQFTQIFQQFQNLTAPTDKIKFLMQLSNLLEKVDPKTHHFLIQIKSCDNSLWFGLDPITKNAYGFSDSRLMQGLLVVIIAKLKNLDKYQNYSTDELLNELQIKNLLSQNKYQSLIEIEKLINS